MPSAGWQAAAPRHPFIGSAGSQQGAGRTAEKPQTTKAGTPAWCPMLPCTTRVPQAPPTAYANNGTGRGVASPGGDLEARGADLRRARGTQWDPPSRGGRPLGSVRQLPPQLTVGRRPLGGGGGAGGQG